MLAEIILPLGSIHILFDLGLDLVAQFKHLDLFVQEKMDLGQALSNIEGLKNSLLLGRGNIEVRGDQVGEDGGRLDVGNHGAQLAGQVRSQLHGPLKEVLQIHHQGVDFHSLYHPFIDYLNLCFEIGLTLKVFLYLHPGNTLDDDALAPVQLPDHS